MPGPAAPRALYPPQQSSPTLHLKISNREPLRLETTAPCTPPSPEPISNREGAQSGRACPRAPIASPNQEGEQKANREPLRLETVVTRTKQTHDPISNREKVAVFYPHFCSPNAPSPIQKGEQKANREPLRLEIAATQTKQRPGPISNREETPLFTTSQPTEVATRISYVLLQPALRKFCQPCGNPYIENKVNPVLLKY
jgi:hypothetical protein